MQDKTIQQINRTLTLKKGTVRGLHFQYPPHSETKIVTCLKGKVWDVAVDLRTESNTYRCWHAVELSPELGNALFIPEGFAHGFLALTDSTEVAYKVTNYYDPKFECIIRYDDPELDIKWPVQSKYNVSEKDTRPPIGLLQGG